MKLKKSKDYDQVHALEVDAQLGADEINVIKQIAKKEGKQAEKSSKRNNLIILLVVAFVLLAFGILVWKSEMQEEGEIKDVSRKIALDEALERELKLDLFQFSGNMTEEAVFLAEVLEEAMTTLSDRVKTQNEKILQLEARVSALESEKLQQQLGIKDPNGRL